MGPRRLRVKVRRPIQRRVEKPLLKPKRLDLNPGQFAILRRLEGLTPVEARSLVHRALKSGSWKLDPAYQRGAFFFWDPKDLSSFLGWSGPTVEKYTDLFLRIVRREGESAQEFRERKSKANPEEAPLTSSLPGWNPGEAPRLVSDRIFLFLILAPTQIRGKNRDLVEFLRAELELPSGKPQKIGPTSPVVKWVV
jgi:hypothetical protein